MFVFHYILDVCMYQVKNVIKFSLFFKRQSNSKVYTSFIERFTLFIYLSFPYVLNISLSLVYDSASRLHHITHLKQYERTVSSSDEWSDSHNKKKSKLILESEAVCWMNNDTSIMISEITSMRVTVDLHEYIRHSQSFIY